MNKITDRELYVKRLLSVVQRNYTADELTEPLLVVSRKEDLMICVLNGESVYEVCGERIKLHSGDVLFLPRGSTYKRWISDESYRTVFVYFLFDENETGLPGYQFFHGTEGMELGFIRLYKKWSARSISYQSECLGLFYQLYASLIRSYTSTYLPWSKRELFDDAVQCISNTNAEEKISVAELAKKAQMSEVHFRRCFKKIYKVSPLEYVSSLRILHAKELLQYSNEAVDRIALSCGFADPAYFSRSFKKKTGYTPSEYRKSFGEK